MYEEDPVDDISIGFYIGLADRGRVKVFNFDVFHEQDVRFDDMVVVEASKANKLNENDVMRKIRDLRFAEKESKKLDSLEKNTSTRCHATTKERRCPRCLKDGDRTSWATCA